MGSGGGLHECDYTVSHITSGDHAFESDIDIDLHTIYYIEI